ncbi:SAM-dependent methyltransferase [Sphingomonas koreensis]|jgi:phosphatidylethanolamine/phosphatidyl-N-methylethanolamine N-methyltransferase|uniref:SAM-dependent methyltransferase n=1 Tax=Sphingomonas koreensis TaxID=93064 RepID=A0A430G726_9SPHN|nr:rRNA adenine N-6-methyltransferase family protein [Sphingomonas koreensis]MDC7811136.1 rRNA adenine N-6-methyltransferase family protein [Sphingomonas koreensis]RSU19311.1 SAM-dependent methyltransferase [Sphingomonas koreensis]RSU28367.1 SAM-dependent methyltransferase [Sphingomonas koreensis]RSU31313.1 SAM-dependent methyltransferase [Sphingomonas koreensis]RSU38145.1 SAM-dependent methyltransferase [Sphingomonas koreensis]
MRWKARRKDHRARRPAAASPLDGIRFFTAWLGNPLSVAAIAPSSKALAQLITRDIDAQTGPVLELGPGTGVFTQALLDRGVAERDLTLVEYDDGFARLLKRRFPQANILSIDAAELAEHRSPSELFGAAVCGLGLLNMKRAKVEAILRAAFMRMHGGAPLYLFTYGRNCPVPDAVLERLDLDAVRVATIRRNIPPASVYRIVSRQAKAD